jgi:cytochrome c oxidase subunit 2
MHGNRRAAGSAGVRCRIAILPVLAAAAVACGGCGKQSPLSPQSGPARDISTLWWVLFGVASLFFLGTVFLLSMSWVLRKREGIPLLGSSSTLTTGAVVAFGMIVPALVLVGVFVVSDLVVIKKTDAPKAATTALTVEVIGHQWFWEVRYGGTAAVTANEIHIPAKTRVDLIGKTADVIHSFWVPQLNRKIDTVPARTNRVLLYADKPGRYRGTCSEFCGLQHAHMGTYVFADPPDRFRAWLAEMARPAKQPISGLARRGEQVFMSSQCESCHTIRGTPADGRVGPDLTHLATRTTLAALAIPNRADKLAAWISNPQSLKPGNKMPALGLSPADVRALVAYLESLR